MSTITPSNTVAPATTSTWALDPAHTLVELSVKHLMFTTVKGRFTEVAGSIVLDEANPERGTVEATIQAASVTTGEPQRDAHLRSPEFLDAQTFPTLTFRGRRTAGDQSRFQVVGDLTIRGVTRAVVLEVEPTGRGVSPYGKEVIGFAATTQIDRRDFGLTWNVALETGGVLVSDTVRVAIEVQAVRQD